MNTTFLVAARDDSMGEVIGEILVASGYRVENVCTLDEAVAILSRLEPEALFVSLEFDNGNGHDLVRAVSVNANDVPMILIVDEQVTDPKEAVFRSGAMTYLKTPVDPVQVERLARQGTAMRRRLVKERQHARETSLTRSFLSAFLGMESDATLLLDAKGVVLEASAASAQLLSVPYDELLGKVYLPLLSRHAAEMQRDAFAKVCSGLRPYHVEEQRDDAMLTTVIRPVIDEGKLAGFVVITKDVSALRRSEAGLAESEKRYQSVYEAARDAIVMVDRADGAILDCNAAARATYGYTAEEMLRLTVLDLADEPERMLEAIRTGVERISFRHHHRKGGESFPVEISMSYFVHDGHEVCTAYIRDISDRKLVEEALREGARLYRAVVEDQTEFICRYAPDGTLSFANQAFAKFFGVDEEEVIGRKFFPRLAPDERRNLKEWLLEASPANPVFEREQHVVRHDGESRWILWTNRAILGHRGAVSGIQAVGRDVTEQREIEQALGVATMEREQYRLNLEATFRSIPDAIVTTDSQLRVIATNSAAGVMLGIDRAHARGMDLETLVDAERNPCISVLKQVLRSGKAVRSYEVVLDVPSLGERMVELNCTPLLDDAKQHSGAVLVVRDVSRIVALEKRLHERHGFRGIIGRSSGMQDIYKLLEQLSSLDSTVLILGESGTGKELVADALHYGGARAGYPLIKVNCSALSESLLESELFGHIRGAFTGAVRDKVGRIQAAQGGTLFLDEIGDISPLVQLKLLRFLEQKEYERVGDSKTNSADVRIIAATNVDLLKAAREGVFREDLYYRLNVMPISLPPLRERPVDIPILVEHFLETFSGQFKKAFNRIADDVMDLFMRYPWPGNIRELRHILEHACILSPGGDIQLKYIRKDMVDQMRASEFVPPKPLVEYSPQMAVSRKAERQDVLDALERCGGNKARAARQLGIHRATLYRKLESWGLAD